MSCFFVDFWMSLLGTEIPAPWYTAQFSAQTYFLLVWQNWEFNIDNAWTCHSYSWFDLLDLSRRMVMLIDFPKHSYVKLAVCRCNQKGMSSKYRGDISRPTMWAPILISWSLNSMNCIYTHHKPYNSQGYVHQLSYRQRKTLHIVGSTGNHHRYKIAV